MGLGRGLKQEGRENQQTHLRGGGSASSPQARHNRLKHSGCGGLETTQPGRTRGPGLAWWDGLIVLGDAQVFPNLKELQRRRCVQTMKPRLPDMKSSNGLPTLVLALPYRERERERERRRRGDERPFDERTKPSPPLTLLSPFLLLSLALWS